MYHRLLYIAIFYKRASLIFIMPLNSRVCRRNRHRVYNLGLNQGHAFDNYSALLLGLAHRYTIYKTACYLLITLSKWQKFINCNFIK